MVGIIFIVFIVLGFLSLLIGIKVKKTWAKAEQRTRDDDLLTISNGFKWAGIGIIALFGFLFLTCCITTVDAGEVKVQVVFGKIIDSVLTEGLSVKSPFASLNTYNIQLREQTMDIKDGNYLQALTKDKLAVRIDATIWWKIVKGDVKMIRRLISAEENDVDDMIVFPAVRSAVRDASVNYTFEEITSVQGRTELTQKIDEILIRLTSDKGVVIDNVLIRNVIPEDGRVTAAIGQKLQQQQELQAKEYELLKSEMDAKIRIKNATGIAEAQHLIDRTLTPEYLQFEAIQMMKDVAHSPNSTFVFVPTQPGQVGMPMVYSLKDFEKPKRLAEQVETQKK